MSALDFEAARSIARAVPLVRLRNRFWPEPTQIGLVGFLVLVIAAEIATLAHAIWSRA